MHIPDGVLNPVTCAVFYGIMAPFWVVSAKRSAKKLDKKMLPMMIAGILFCLALMSVDIRLPGGSTGHAIGATLLSAIFGPWIGTFVVSITLAIQAYLFHDGGVTALGANCFSMAFVPSLITAIFLNFNKSGNIVKSSIFAGIGGYFGLVFAALAVGMILKFSNAPISVSDTVIQHLVAFGWLEATITASLFAVIMSEKSPFYSLITSRTAEVKE